MKLDIRSLKGVEFSGDVRGFNVKTLSGEITILDHHLPIVAVIVECKAKILKEDGDVEEKAIKAGFLEMDSKNNLMVLAD